MVKRKRVFLAMKTIPKDNPEKIFSEVNGGPASVKHLVT